jgi:ABC-2 type transport system permease protein
MNFLVMPNFFLAGALFPLAGLPKVMEVVADLDPLSYGVDGLRVALFGVGTFLFPRIQL